MSLSKVTEKMKLIVMLMLCVLVLAACGDKNTEGTDASQKNTETESQNDKDSQKETESEAVTETEKVTEGETESETQKETESETESQEGTSDTTKPSEGNTNSNTNNNTDNSGDNQTQTQQPTTTNPSGEEIIGEGSASQPLMETPKVVGDAMVLETISVPAGKIVHYGIYRVGGMILTINDANAYVVCDGTRYDAVNGVVSFQVVRALASDAVAFQIGNKAGTATSFTLTFTNGAGSYMNPTIVSTLDSRSTILEAGDEVGHYYKYTAQKTGTLRIYISNYDTKSHDLSVTNLATSANRTFAADASADYIDIAVTAGDELLIQVHAKPDRRFKYPAATITWYGQYQ